MHDYNPGIVCLQETKLGNASFHLGMNYEMYNSAPLPGDRAHGGAAIIVNKSIQHSVLSINSPLQAVAVNAMLGKGLKICSVYLPGAVGFSRNDLQNLINKLPNPFLLLGYFNAHNPLWGGNDLDTSGRIIEDILKLMMFIYLMMAL